MRKTRENKKLCGKSSPFETRSSGPTMATSRPPKPLLCTDLGTAKKEKKSFISVSVKPQGQPLPASESQYDRLRDLDLSVLEAFPLAARKPTRDGHDSGHLEVHSRTNQLVKSTGAVVVSHSRGFAWYTARPAPGHMTFGYRHGSRCQGGFLFSPPPSPTRTY